MKNEILRLKTLAEYHIMDTAPEPDFDSLVQMASRICKTPIAVMSLMGENYQWFKAKVGIEGESSDRDISFCGHAIQSSEVMVINDATLDERFCDNPAVTGGPMVKFYAGAPLNAPNGQAIGTLCVADSFARELTGEQEEFLKLLAKQAMTLLEYRKTLMAMRETMESFRNVVGEIDHNMETIINEEKRQTVGGLASGVAHEINNPLAIIVSTASALMKKIDISPDLIKPDIDVIIKTALRLAGVVNELQKVSEMNHSLFINGKTFEEEFSVAVKKRKTG